MGCRHRVLAGGFFRQGKHPGQARAHAQLIGPLHGRDLFQQTVHLPAELGLIHVQALQHKLEEPVRLAAHGGQQMDGGQFLVVIHNGLLLGSFQQSTHFITQAFCLHNKHLQKPLDQWVIFFIQSPKQTGPGKSLFSLPGSYYTH